VSGSGACSTCDWTRESPKPHSGSLREVLRAVVFDLWQTLAVWPEELSSTLRREWSESLGVGAERLDELWYADDVHELRESGPIVPAIAALYERLGVHAEPEHILARRLELTRAGLVPVPGALSTIGELRRRGVATGLISNCTEEVPLVWDESEFAGVFDVAIFSATAGCLKPAPEIYELALARLRVEASECLFVGDGASGELEGARRVGMTSVLVCPPGEEPRWNGLRDWAGLRIASIPQVLELLP
jgi:putative hydrolase of the HAD superfamily